MSPRLQQLELFPELTTPANEPAVDAQAEPIEPAEPSRMPMRPSLRRRLEEAIGEPLASLVTTENRSRIVSARRSHAGFEVRIHRVFETADEATLSALADVLTAERRSERRRHALARVRQHFESHRPELEPRRETLRPVGRTFDLNALRDRVNAEYFDGRLEVEMTWGRQRRIGRRKRGSSYSLRLGSYDEQRRLVRLHPCLDRPDIPEYVVESVVYHEMLHAAVPPERRGGRRYVHTREFRRRERLYRHFDAANRWLEANLERLAGLR